MKLATLACLAALCLGAPQALAAPGDPVPAEQPRREHAPANPKATPAKPEVTKAEGSAARGEAKQEAARAEKPAAGAPVSGRERRRRSYAACNRASHQRGYHGGRRRRFLIRCRLGYERTRTPQQQHQAPASTPAGTPVRKP